MASQPWDWDKLKQRRELKVRRQTEKIIEATDRRQKGTIQTTARNNHILNVVDLASCCSPLQKTQSFSFKGSVLEKSCYELPAGNVQNGLRIVSEFLTQQKWFLSTKQKWNDNVTQKGQILTLFKSGAVASYCTSCPRFQWSYLWNYILFMESTLESGPKWAVDMFSCC